MKMWISEQEDNLLRFGYAVNEHLYSKKSKFQQIDIFETSAYGRAMFIDGLMMTTEADEFVYHEMISHMPMALSGQSPKKAVVIGGGDGGTVRELARYDSLESIILCEIDACVIEAAKDFLPDHTRALDDPRVEVKIADGIRYIQEHKGGIDILVIDSTDPIGPGEGLFTSEFYKNASKALSSSGVLVAQTESPWYQADLIAGIQRKIASGFRYSRPFIAPVPTYPRGLWSWTLATNHLPIEKASFDFSQLKPFENKLRFANQEILLQSLNLPKFYRDKVGSAFKSS